MNSIFANQNFFELSDPQPSWMYHVIFYLKSGGPGFTKNNLFVDSINLPKYETTIVTKKFFGSERSYPVLRTYGGDIDMTFTLRTEYNENKDIFRLTQLFARYLYKNDSSILYPTHPELEQSTAQKNTAVLGKDDETGETLTNSYLTYKTGKYVTIDKIEILFNDKTGNTLKTDRYTGKKKVLTELEKEPGDTLKPEDFSPYTLVFTYENCIIKDFSFENELGYSSDDVVKCKLTFHSDIWTTSRMDMDENEKYKSNH